VIFINDILKKSLDEFISLIAMVKKKSFQKNSFIGAGKKLLFGLCLLMIVVSVNISLTFAGTNESTTITQQKVSVTGTVKDVTGIPMPGVSVVIKGTTIGSVTDADGKYSINVSNMDSVLQFSFLGYETLEKQVANQKQINVTLIEKAIAIDEVVVTGVATGTPKSKLTFTVEKVGGEKLSAVPAMSAATSLQGKIPGIQIFSNSGNPNEDPVILLRGSTSITGTTQPLIIIDGVLTEGKITDVNAEDIERIEVLKGAASAAFYGAKAANGVIHIITKRGTMLNPGQVVVGVKSETGVMWQPFKPMRTTAHRYATDPVTGKVDKNHPDPDFIEDNKYQHYFGDPYDIFTPSIYYTAMATLTGNSSNGISYYGSYQFQNREGVVFLLKGVQRSNIRLNLDHKVNDKFSWSASNSFMKSISDDYNINFDDVFYADPNVNLWEPNIDGTPYKYQPNIVSTRNNVNPLYTANNTIAESDQMRFTGGYKMIYRPIGNLTISGMYSIDFRNNYYTYLEPAGLLTSNNPEGARSTGYMYEGDDRNTKQNLSFDAMYAEMIGDFNVKFKIGSIFEDFRYDEKWASGSNLALYGKDVVTLNLIDPTTLGVSSNSGKITSQSYSAMFMGDYKEKYMVDLLVRRDGVSSLGSNERWQNFYRVSGAWNMAKEFNIEKIDYLKPRISLGTAGLYPDFSNQYETYDLGSGILGTPNQLGNKNLKPALSKELEVGLDFGFLKRFDIVATYAMKNSTNLIYPVPVSSVTGFSYQYQNVASKNGKIFELSFSAKVIEKKNLSMETTLTFDKMTEHIGELNQDGFMLGYEKIETGERVGNMYGSALATSLDQVKTSTLIKPGQTVDDVFTINNYGWVVRKDLIGTRDETRMYILDDNGNNKSNNLIGNSEPDFIMNLMNVLNWKHCQLYFNLSWKQGGDMFNNTKMYMSFAGENAYLRDMSERPWSQRKASTYVSHARAQMTESTTNLRLRELALSYTFNNRQLSKARLSFIKGIRIAAVARNLITLTNFSGTDPESRTYQEGTMTAFDTPKYPGGAATFTGQLSIEF